ncbi:Hypothetical protein R9X50_00181000 [Acrodontium crateriforme]|uniref:Major facilitator superfamily (MFS) profile domain-containing protein n=1 Tax=Acrodontium crateriforme TaxID=150365 RepID=A0AAQ3R647_9PEZI|nr:Hypothetical protein R9X50_00181000 [Acrodontium crateriforme]
MPESENPTQSGVDTANSNALYDGRELESTGTEPGRGDAPDIPNSNGRPNEDEIENPERPKGIRFAVLFCCILLGDFFVGYDSSCVATLAPVITDQFNSLNQVGWYGTSYLLASCATILIYGQLYSYYSMKANYEIAFLIFVLGSVVTAAAPSSAIFIFGRALSGLGSAGVFAGSSIIVANSTSLKHRPIYQAMSGGVESIALALGPLISGAVSHGSSWRVSFYIIIPVGIACIVSVFFFVHNLQRPENADLSNNEKLRKLDLVGFAIYVPTVICFILGLQWAGSEYPWGNWRIILLLVLAAVLAVAFFATEYGAGDDGMFPLKMLRQRTVWLSSAYTFCNSAGLFVVAYYLPIYFQAVRGQTTLGSGLWYLPTALSFALAILAAGPATSFVGYYNPMLIIGSVLMAVGTGLMTTCTPHTPLGQWIGYQILYGVGCGLAFQQPYTAVQIVLPEDRVPTALVTLSFTQEIGGIVALSVAQNVYVNRLAHQLATQVPGLDSGIVLNNGALGIIDKVPPEFREQALNAYSAAIIDVFYIALGLTCLTCLLALGFQWRSVKEDKKDE